MSIQKIKYGNKTKFHQSFSEWCIDNNHQDFLDRWDYNLNEKTPNEVSSKSNLKYWFQCPNKLHGSELQNIQYFASGKQTNMYCKKCESFAQFIINNYGIAFLDMIWSNKNELSAWDYSKKSNKKVWLVCDKNHEHIYQQSCLHYADGIRCPFCSHQKIVYSNSLGIVYPDVNIVWSDKNHTTPFDYYSQSGIKVWFKCGEDKHIDYQRQIASAVNKNFLCPQCEKEHRTYYYGENHPQWKGGINGENNTLRHSKEYKEWRNKCYQLDNYTCQCCGSYGGRLRCHHLYSFAKYDNLRFDIMNGITLCEDCHDSIKSGSFHNMYGTDNNTPEELEEYINDERHDIGIDIHFSIDEYLKNKENNIVKAS